MRHLHQQPLCRFQVFPGLPDIVTDAIEALIFVLVQSSLAIPQSLSENQAHRQRDNANADNRRPNSIRVRRTEDPERNAADQEGELFAKLRPWSSCEQTEAAHAEMVTCRRRRATRKLGSVAIDREMLIGQRHVLLGQGAHPDKERSRHVAVEQVRPVLAEHRRVPDRDRRHPAGRTSGTAGCSRAALSAAPRCGSSAVPGAESRAQLLRRDRGPTGARIEAGRTGTTADNLKPPLDTLAPIELGVSGEREREEPTIRRFGARDFRSNAMSIAGPSVVNPPPVW